jgi:hypothetical protein
MSAQSRAVYLYTYTGKPAKTCVLGEARTFHVCGGNPVAQSNQTIITISQTQERIDNPPSYISLSLVRSPRLRLHISQLWKQTLYLLLTNRTTGTTEIVLLSSGSTGRPILTLGVYTLEEIAPEKAQLLMSLKSALRRVRQDMQDIERNAQVPHTSYHGADQRRRIFSPRARTGHYPWR